MSQVIINNPRLREFIRNNIGLPRYGEPFDTLVEEVFVREQHVLGLSPKEFLEDISNFSASINKISFVDTPETWMGCQFPASHEIQLNLGYWQDRIDRIPREQYCEELFETISHECLHGMQTRLDGRNRAERYNIEIKNRAHSIYEIGTQAIAAKMAYSRTTNDWFSNSILTGEGYAGEIFAVPLLSATFGVSEQELLKYMVRDRNQLVEALDKNIGNRQVTAQYIDLIENQLEYMHSINYPDKNQKLFANMSQTEKAESSTKALKNIITLCKSVMEDRIKNVPLELDRGTAQQLKYDFRKIYDTLGQEEMKFFYMYEPGVDFIKDFIKGPHSKYIQNSIDIYDQITQSDDPYIKTNIPTYVNRIRTASFKDIKKHGVKPRKNKDFLYSPDISPEMAYEKITKDYNDFAQWDNSRINAKMYERKNIAPRFVSKIGIHDCDDRYSYQGEQKILAIKSVLLGNKVRHGKLSKDILYGFIQRQGFDLEDVYRRITRTPVVIGENSISPRQAFKSNFQTDRDRVFLAQLIAQSYVNKTFDNDGKLKIRDNQEEYKLQQILADTACSNGPSYVRDALVNVLINDDYSKLHREVDKDSLSMYGNRRLFEIISTPFIEEMTNVRTILPEKKDFLRQVTGFEENRIPNSMMFRFGVMINQYKHGMFPSEQLMPQEVRSEFSYYFKNERGVEDLVGMICDDYSEKDEMNYYRGVTPKSREEATLRSTIRRYGKDYFRENMIKKILHDDYSGFISADEISSYKNMDSVELIKAISSPFITKSQYYKNSHRFKTEYMLGKSTVVKPSNIKEVLSVKTRIKKGLNETIESLRNVFKGGKTNTYGKSYGVSPQENNETQIDEEEER